MQFIIHSIPSHQSHTLMISVSILSVIFFLIQIFICRCCFS
nr:MAG TPA: hypothetical protein [Caudoviricetes sp.]